MDYWSNGILEWWKNEKWKMENENWFFRCKTSVLERPAFVRRFCAGPRNSVSIDIIDETKFLEHVCSQTGVRNKIIYL